MVQMPDFYRDKNFLEIKKITNFALFVSIAIVMSVIESLIPISFLIPGVKLGLSNVILLILLDYYNFKQLLLYQFIRVSISTFVLGLFSVFLYSIIGAILALLLMSLARLIFKDRVTIYTLSMLGAIGHNIGQIAVAIFMLKSFLLLGYLPFLIIFGCFTGFIVAHITQKVAPQIRRTLSYDTVKELFS